MLYLASISILALVSLDAALADHQTCSWRGPGPRNPTKYGFVLFCSAPKHIVDDQHARYLCEGNNIKVADFNFLGPGLLEFGTPCNNQGYAENCKDSTWGLCIAPHGTGTAEPQIAPSCFYMARYDDCQWPQQFNLSTLPDAVFIYLNGR